MKYCLIKIKNCNDCPFVQYSYRGCKRVYFCKCQQDACDSFNDWIVLDTKHNKIQIPKWCPLKDYK